MAECGGWRNDATRRLYTVLHDEWVFRHMIVDCLVQCAEKGCSKSDAADALYSEIVGWVYSDYNVALVNTPALIQALMMENPFEMDIDWGAIIDTFMKDYDDIVRANKPKASDNRKPRTASSKNTRSKAAPKRR